MPNEVATLEALVAIGDELTSGQRLDTNSQWLSQRLGELGIPVHFHTTVGDDLESCAEVFRLDVQSGSVRCSGSTPGCAVSVGRRL